MQIVKEVARTISEGNLSIILFRRCLLVSAEKKFLRSFFFKSDRIPF